MNDLKTVHLGTKFSCRFTLQDLKDRWRILLYDQKFSGLAMDSMRKLHPELIEKAERNVLFSPEEEKCLTTIPEPYPDINEFESLMTENKEVFHPARKTKDLYEHFQLMESYDLLPEQEVDPLPGVSFSDFEANMKDRDLGNIDMHPGLKKESCLSQRQSIARIRHYEREVDRWSATITSLAPPMDNDTLAVLRGSTVRFIMKSIKITFGRDTKDNKVDVDLSLEGPTDKISRRQGTLELRGNGAFYLSNDGKRTIFVGGDPLLTGHSCILPHQSLVEIVDLGFVFLVNQELVTAIREENKKLSKM